MQHGNGDRLKRLFILIKEHQRGAKKVMTMTYETFLKITEEQIKDFLPESCQDKTVVIEPRTKNNGIVQYGFTMRGRKGAEPFLYLELFYEEYRQGRKLEDIWRELAKQYETAQKKIQDISIPMAYEKVKDNLYVSVCNAEQNAQRLLDIPHDIKEDLALTCHYRVILPDGKVGDIMIDNRCLTHWGISKEQLQTDAWNNMKKIMPPVFLTMDEMLEQLEGKSSYEAFSQKKMRPIEDIETDTFLYVLTNTEADYGAVYMFDDELMTRIAERLDSNLLVLPSSIHELIILKEIKNVEPMNLHLMVEEINKDVVRPEDKLSDEVYWYDRETHSLKAMIGQDYLQNWQIKME